MNFVARGVVLVIILQSQAGIFSERCSGTTINFDQETDLDRLSKRNQFQWFPAQWQATGGIGNSGSLIPFGSHPNESALGESLEMSTIGDRIKQSAYFRTESYSVLDQTQAQRFGDIYIVSRLNSYPNESASIDVSFYRTATANWLSASLFPGSATVVSFPTGTIKEFEWYRLQAVFTHLPDSRLQWDVELRDYGADGLTDGGVVMSLTDSIIDTQLITTRSQLFGGLEVPFIGDDFTVTAIPAPEPGTTLLILTAIACFFGLRCYRR